MLHIHFFGNDSQKIRVNVDIFAGLQAFFYDLDEPDDDLIDNDLDMDSEPDDEDLTIY